MNEPLEEEPKTPSDLLARFITAKVWVRKDGTIRQDAFMPPKDLNLSVTRHLRLSEEDLWRIGQAIVLKIGEGRTAALLGRADLHDHEVTRLALNTVPAPRPGNPNHVHITGWPAEKPKQKTLALNLAAVARYIAKGAPAVEQ
jgi:hypothetical protein